MSGFHRPPGSGKKENPLKMNEEALVYIDAMRRMVRKYRLNLISTCTMPTAMCGG
jgi:hypothetical protein